MPEWTFLEKEELCFPFLPSVVVCGRAGAPVLFCTTSKILTATTSTVLFLLTIKCLRRWMYSQSVLKWRLPLLAITAILVLDCFQVNVMAITYPPQASYGVVDCLEKDNEGRLLNEDLKLQSLATLSSSNCMLFNESRETKEVYPLLTQSFSAKEIHCLSSIPQLAACSACHLCHYHLYHENSLAAFTNALLSLQSFPLSAPSVSCLGAIYFKHKNFLRSAFYSTVSHEYNSSWENIYAHSGNDHHSLAFMKDNYRDVLFPDYQNIAEAMRQDLHNSNNPYSTLFADICEQLKGFYSLFTIYSNHLHHLPRWMVGPDIIAYESFLDAFENAVRPYTLPSARGSNHEDSSFLTTILEPQLNAAAEKVRELVHWPADKYIILHNDNSVESSTYLYGDYIQGLSDSLNRLGVPHKLSSISPQQRDDNSLKDSTEIVQLPAATASQGKGSFYRYVQWHMEHPVDDQCTSKYQCTEEVFDSRVTTCGGGLTAKERPCQAASWESSLTALFSGLHPDTLPSKANTPRHLNALCPEHLMMATRAEHQFATGLLSMSTPSTFYEERDLGRPIDILVLGLQNVDRSELYSSLVRFALQQHLTLTFFMDFEEFSIEKERHLIHDAKVVVTLMQQSSEEACPLSASHLFKARQLLAMGKVVISESLDIKSFDEEVLREYVTFSTSANIANVTSALLKSPAARWELEKKGIQYILLDHFEQKVSLTNDGRNNNDAIQYQHSSLSLLADALNNLAASLWPEDDAPAKELLESQEDKLLVEEEVKKDATRAEQALLWAEKYCQQNSLISDTTNNNLAIHNASHPCYKKSRFRILMGYLRRRYESSGKVLWVGCEKGAKKQSTLGNLKREFKLNCVFPTPAALKIMLKKFKKQSFELIFINQEVIQYSFEEFQEVMPMLMKYLNTKIGCVIMNSIIPMGKPMVENETWKFLIHLKSFLDVDSALGAFDNGLLVLRIRRNTYMLRDDSEEIEAITQEQHEFRDLTPSEYFFEIADSFIPVLDLFHMHEWLSEENVGTAKFTSIPWDKVCVSPPNNQTSNGHHVAQRRERPIVLCNQ